MDQYALPVGLAVNTVVFAKELANALGAGFEVFVETEAGRLSEGYVTAKDGVLLTEAEIGIITAITLAHDPLVKSEAEVADVERQAALLRLMDRAILDSTVRDILIVFGGLDAG